MSDAGVFVEFKIDHSETKNAAVGSVVYSDVIAAGGHNWKIKCYPHGLDEKDNGEYMSVFLWLVSKSQNVKALFDVIPMGKDGEPSLDHALRTVRVFTSDNVQDWGWRRFVKRSDLEANYVLNGCITFLCGIVVIRDNPIRVPPSDIASHLGNLLQKDRTDGKDVSFLVDGETFCAHRLLLAARSPVFKAELFGPMSESTAPCITLHEMKASTFKALLRFLYTDCLPADEEFNTELFQHLLGAADRYALDRLKLMCEDKLWSNVSVDTVATTLACAEMYCCPELKTRCLDFLVKGENFKMAALTDGYLQLMQNFPSIVGELRTILGTTTQ